MKRASPDALQKALAGSAKANKKAAPVAANEPDEAEERPGRAGQQYIGAWLDKGVSIQFQRLSLNLTEKTGKRVLLRDLIREAYNDLFEKNGMSRIA